MLVKSELPKEFAPIKVTELGITKEAKAEQPLNAYSPMLVTVFESCTLTKFTLLGYRYETIKLSGTEVNDED